MEKGDLQPSAKTVEKPYKICYYKNEFFLGIEVRPSEKKRMCEPVCLPVFQCGSCGFVCAFCRHGSEEHYACLRSETGLSFFDFTRAFQKHPDKCRRIDRTSAGVCKADQRLRHRSGVETQVLIMLAVLLANTVFYKAKKHLLTRNDADGRRFIICYIHHQDGQKH